MIRSPRSLLGCAALLGAACQTPPRLEIQPAPVTITAPATARATPPATPAITSAAAATPAAPPATPPPAQPRRAPRVRTPAALATTPPAPTVPAPATRIDGPLPDSIAVPPPPVDARPRCMMTRAGSRWCDEHLDMRARVRLRTGKRP